MRLIALSTCFCLSLLMVVLLCVSCLTRSWWVSKDHLNAGLWEHCYDKPKHRCEKFDIKLKYKLPTNESVEDIKNIKDNETSAAKHLNTIRGCAVVSLAFSILMLLLETILLHFIRRKTQVEFSWWLKLVTLLCNLVTTVTSMIACILAANYDVIFEIQVELKGSWLCMLIASILSFLIGVCLIAIFLKRPSSTNTKTGHQSRKRKFTNAIPIHMQFGNNDVHRVPSLKRPKSPPFVIPTSTNVAATATTTPYHNHPYMQYHADSAEPHYIEGHLEPMSDNYTSASAENLKIALSNMSDYSTDQYADLTLDDLPANLKTSTSFANLTHSYEDLVDENGNPPEGLV